MDTKLKSGQIEHLKVCGKILKIALLEVLDAIKPGINGLALDKIAEKAIRKQGARPSFLNYGEDSNPFPATICLSINDEVVHGVPLKEKIIRDGDLVSVDIGAEFHGIYTDTSATVVAGETKSNIDKKLLKVTKEALSLGINAAVAGAYTGDIGAVIQNHVEKNGFNVVKALVGHGIGTAPHQDPQVPNFGKRGTGVLLEPNMAIAIEPMVNIGTGDVKTSSDGWTVKTYDGARSAHFEHTILITQAKPVIITQ